MKKTLLFILSLGFLASANAQPWTYNFGTTTGATSGSANTINSPNALLLSPQTNGGNARIRHQGTAGVVDYVTSGAAFISGSALRQQISTSTSGTKFSIFNIINQTKYFDVSYNFKINTSGVATGGSFFLAVGAEASTALVPIETFFKNSSNLTITDTALTYIRININPTGNHSFRVGNLPSGGGGVTQTTLSTTLNPNIAAITNSTEHLIRVLCNASNNSVQYTIVNNSVSTNYTITPRSYHIWFDGNLLFLAENNPNFTSVNPDILNYNRLNAFGIFGNSAPSASVILDNFSYNVTLPNLVVLPVSLTSFTARKSNSQIQLAWSTASESNNSHFEIERSVNGTDFVKIGERKGAGNSSSILKYSFLDNNPANGTNYYRLKQVDFDGKFEYSDIEAASLDSDVALALKYLASQDANQVKFEINTQKNASGSLIIYDLSGRRVAKQDLLLKEGSNPVSLSMLNLNSGVYFAACQVDGKVVTQKFVK
jgi:hypothetical protein